MCKFYFFPRKRGREREVEKKQKKTEKQRNNERKMNQHFQRIFLARYLFFCSQWPLTMKTEKKIIDQKIVLRPNAPMTTTTITHNNTKKKENERNSISLPARFVCVPLIAIKHSMCKIETYLFSIGYSNFVSSPILKYLTHTCMCVYSVTSFVIFWFETTFISLSIYHHSSACVK